MSLDDSLAAADPEVAEAVAAELRRQQQTLEMIASENFAPVSVLEAQGSVLTNKYAEGYPGRRYYGAASTSTSPSSSRSTGPGRCSARTTPTSSRTAGRRRTRRSTSRCSSTATRSSASTSRTAGTSRTGCG